MSKVRSHFASNTFMPIHKCRVRYDSYKVQYLPVRAAFTILGYAECVEPEIQWLLLQNPSAPQYPNKTLKWYKQLSRPLIRTTQSAVEMVLRKKAAINPK